MKKNILLFLLILFFGCKTKQNIGITEDLEVYNHKKSNKQGYVPKDYYKAGMYLINLGKSSKKAYQLFYKAIKQHDTLCYLIHEYQDNYKNYGFQTNIIRADTIRWKKLCSKCEKIIPLEKYNEKKAQKELGYKKRKALFESKLDSNLLDKQLIYLLSMIIEKDQLVRANPNLKKQSEEWVKQKELDSLNLIQIDSIFKAKGGYPSLQKVG